MLLIRKLYIQKVFKIFVMCGAHSPSHKIRHP